VPRVLLQLSRDRVTPRDIERLAKRFELGYREAEERFTKYEPKENVRLLRHKKDTVFDTVCTFLDQEARRCTVYESRPACAAPIPTASTAATTTSCSSSAPTGGPGVHRFDG
jgi:hypothetical protein